MKCASPLSIVLAIALFALTACQSPAVPDIAASAGPLDEGELRETLLGHTLSRTGGPLWRRWDYAGVHRADGTIAGRVSWSGGEEVASGVWDISSESLYCRTWNNNWGDGRRGCFQVWRGGDVLVFDHVSGSPGDDDRYAYRLLPKEP
jgi:hypothetical protein